MWATEIKVRAERKAGELLAASEKAVGADYGSRHYVDGRIDRPSSPPPRLVDMGISKDQSSRWQALAAMPEEHFGSIKDAAVLSHGDIVNAPGNTFQLIFYGKCSRCFRLWLAE